MVRKFITTKLDPFDRRVSSLSGSLFASSLVPPLWLSASVLTGSGVSSSRCVVAAFVARSTFAEVVVGVVVEKRIVVGLMVVVSGAAMQIFPYVVKK